MTQPAPKRNESDVYDRQIRLWGAEAQVCKIFANDVRVLHLENVNTIVGFPHTA